MNPHAPRNARRRAAAPDAGGWSPRPPFFLAPALRPWLQEAGSLTARILAHAPTGSAFRVDVLSQGPARPLADEAALAATPRGERALSRDVALRLDGRAVVYAHTVVHRDHARHPWHWLDRLGARPLGGLLFTHPGVVAGPHYFRLLDVRHPLYRRAAAQLAGTAVPPRLAARRAIFTLDGSPLLVTEVFLPDLLRLCPPRLD